MTKKFVKLIVGWIFLILGILGFFLPILQGFLFTAVGLVILAEESAFVRRLLKPLEQKYPQQFEKVYAFRNAFYRKMRVILRWITTEVHEFRCSAARKCCMLFSRKKSAPPKTPSSVDKD